MRMNEQEYGKGNDGVIQFLHANAYTPGCYTQMFDKLSNYKIIAPEQRPLWDNSDPERFSSWGVLADDIISHMDKVGRKGVIGIGHSMGGVASWLAAIKRPDLFSRLILIDPVILPLSYTLGMQWIPMNLKRKYVPMIKIASRRRDTWTDLSSAKQYFLSKKVYQRFDDRALDDFTNYGLKTHTDGVTLAYPRAWEAKVYGTAPYLWGKMSKSPCPLTIIRAEYSDVIDDEGWKKIQSKVARGHFIQADGAGHLVPFEQPELCANIIKADIKRL